MGILLKLLVAAAGLVATTIDTPSATSASPTERPIDVVLTANGLMDSAATAHDNRDTSDGWRMTNRFRGFRFQVKDATTGHNVDMGAIVQRTAEIARQQRCFGWIQAKEEEPTILGEARCSTASAERLMAHLHSIGGVDTIKEYPNTKIRYHFPSFRVLNEPRYQGKMELQAY